VKKISNIKKTAQFIFAVFFVTQGFCQKYPIILLPGSQKIEYNKKTGEHKLLGTVNFTYKGNTMYCDSAAYNEKSQTIKAFGNVHIQKDQLNLYCDSFYYKTSIKYAKLWGNVRIRDAEYKITTDSIDYDAKNGRAIYRNYGKIESIISSEKISSKSGYLYPETRNVSFSGKVKYSKDGLSMSTDTLKFNYTKQIAYFYGQTSIKNDSVQIYCNKGWYDVARERAQLFRSVKVIKSDLSIGADTLYYDAKKNEYKAKGHAWYNDRKENLSCSANNLFSSDDKKVSYATGDAIATKLIREDTLFLIADTIQLNKDSLLNLQYLNAFYKVKFWFGKMSGIADSICYSVSKKQVSLYDSPIIWAENAELKGDSMLVYINDSVVDSTLIFGNSSAVMEVDSGKYYNQVSGKTILAFFMNEELSKIDVKGNAWTIFYPSNEIQNDSITTIKRIGMNRLFASELRIYLDSGEVNKITYFEKPDGIFFPMDQLDEKEKWITGFQWNPMLKPQRAKK
jgi:lipopolysaccharide export system protein LptA